MPGTSAKVKICGITHLHDAEQAAALGAWAIGMVFYEPSPRRCSLEQALRITTALHRKTELCGVFVNATLEELARHTDQLGLTMLQLHGDEGPAFCSRGAAAHRGARDQGGADRRRRRPPRAGALPRGLSPRGRARQVPGQEGSARRDGRDIRLEPAREQARDCAADSQRRADSRTTSPTRSPTSGRMRWTRPAAPSARPGRKDGAKLRAFFAAVQASSLAVPA